MTRPFSFRQQSQTTPRRASVCDLHEQPYATHEQPSHTSRSRREHDATPSPTDSDSEHEPDDAGWTTLEDTSFMEEQNVIVDDEEAPQIDIDETQALHFFVRLATVSSQKKAPDTDSPFPRPGERLLRHHVCVHKYKLLINTESAIPPDIVSPRTSYQCKNVSSLLYSYHIKSFRTIM